MEKPKIDPFVDGLPIPGYSRYRISKCGNIYNTQTNKWMKTYLNSSGKKKPYVKINLYADDGGRYKCRLHRLLALTYIPNPDPENYDMVLHKDDNKNNNSLDNLMWGNMEMNSHQAYQNGCFDECGRHGRLGVSVIGKNLLTGEIRIFESLKDASKYIKPDGASIHTWIRRICNKTPYRNKRCYRAYNWTFKTLDDVGDFPI